MDAQLGLALAQRAAEGSKNDELVGTLGEALVANGKLDAGLEAYVRAHRLDPDDCAWLRCMVEIDPDRTEAVLAKWADIPTASDEIFILADVMKTRRFLQQLERIEDFPNTIFVVMHGRLSEAQKNI